MRPRLLPVVCACLAAPCLAAQEPAFEVASVRPSQSTQASEIRPTPFGRFTATNATVRSLVLRAYGLVDAQLIGAPAWLNSERYDIDARVDAAPPGGPEALLPMVRTLLAERFKLVAHAEMRELPAYALTFARRDRQPGPEMRATLTDCTRASTLTADEVRAAVRDGWPPWRVRRSGITMPALAIALQRLVDRPVVDQTGLGGRFDVEYAYDRAA